MRKFSYWKMDDFTKTVLEMVNQDEHYEALWVLRHSPAARRIFAEMQYVHHFSDSHGYFCEEMAYRKSLDDLSSDVINLHPWSRNRLNPRRIIVTGYDFLRLMEALHEEAVTDEYGKTRIKTIEGWWQV